MLARRVMPPSYSTWNRTYGAPSGRRLYRWTRELPHGSRLLDTTLFTIAPSLRGPFGFQPNNDTRRVEYPWAFFATPISKDLKVLEIGGGLSGFQFVLDRAGCHVVNVDPGNDAHGRGWPVNRERISSLNRAFGTNVQLYNCFLSEAGLPRGAFDRVFSISVIEHVPLNDSPAIMALAFDLLKPGGYFVLTVDLFLNLKPFSSLDVNVFGTNVSVRMLAESAPFELVHGKRAELFGYPEFDVDGVLRNLDVLMIGEYPSIPQLVVLRKPETL
jgi:SAM-dependent methyltransferase